MKLVKIAAGIPDTGLISPEGKVYDLGDHSYHAELASEIVRKDPELLKKYTKAKQEADAEDSRLTSLDYLLNLGWIRVIKDASNFLSLEFSNIDLAKKILNKILPASGLTVNVEYIPSVSYPGTHFRGDVSKFMDWDGQPKAYVSPYKVSKKVNAMNNTSGFLAPSGNFYPFGDFTSHWDLARAYLNSLNTLKLEDRGVFEEYLKTHKNTPQETVDLVEYLLGKGWVRVAQSGGPVPLNFEFGGDLDRAKQLISKTFKDFMGVAFFQWKDESMHGNMEKFMKWSGDAPAYVSPYRISKKIKLLRIASEDPKKSGWVDPSGKFYPSEVKWSRTGIHNKLAKRIIQSPEWRDNPEFKEFIDSGEMHMPSDQEACTNFLLSQGWTRLIGTEEDAGVIQIESLSNLDAFKNFLKNSFPNFFGDVIAQYQGDFFSGSVDEFLNWNGKKQRSLYDRFGKKKADLNSLTRNIDTLKGPGTHTVPMEYGDEEIQDIYPGQKEPLDTRHNSGEDDEFVHTHPTKGCPRYDLRKLKIVDEDDSAGSEEE